MKSAKRIMAVVMAILLTVTMLPANTVKAGTAKITVTSKADAGKKATIKVKVTVPVTDLSDVMLKQDKLALSAGKDYVLSMDVYGDQARSIRVSVAGIENEIPVGTEKKNVRVKFTTPETLTDTSIVLKLGVAGTTYIDNVRVTEDALIVNGDFSNGTTGFTPYVYDSYAVDGQTITLAKYWVDSLEEPDAMKYEIYNTGDQDWHIQLKQENVTLEKGQWYKISFKIKSTLPRTVKYAMQHDGSLQ